MDGKHRGRQRTWDTERAKELCEQGFSDADVAEHVGATEKAIKVWRNRNHIATNSIKSVHKISVTPEVKSEDEIKYVEIDHVKKEHSMTRKEILAAAEACVCGQREEDYGSPEDNFRTIAELWQAYTKARRKSNGADYEMKPEDVACMMTLLKIARIASGRGTNDCWIDLAGYAACGGEIAGGAK